MSSLGERVARISYPNQMQAPCRSRGPGRRAVASGKYFRNLFRGSSAPAHLQQSPHDIPHHVIQETVSCNGVDEFVRLPVQLGGAYRADERSFVEMLASVETDRLPGLSMVCREKLGKYGIRQVGQIQGLERGALTKRFGSREGERLYSLVRGLDVAHSRPRNRELSGESVLDRDINDQFLLEQQARLATDRLCDWLRREGCVARRLTFQLRYTDNRTAQRSVVLPAATDDFRVLSEAAVGLFREAYQRRVAIKSMHVVASRPSRDSGQLDLFGGEKEHRRRSLGTAITDIRTRMGFDAVLSATSLGKEATGPAGSTCG